MRPSFLRLFATLLTLGLLAAAPPRAAGQEGLAHVQLGVGALPGMGLQTGYVSARGFYAIDGMVILHATPRFAGGENDVQIAAAFGAALRPLGVVQTIGNTGYLPYNIDLGLRLGPGLTFFGGDETLADKNKRFSLVFEPFVRVTTDLVLGGAARTFFLEAGIQRPYLRTGIWLDL